jgi:hypothetical protein
LDTVLAPERKGQGHHEVQVVLRRSDATPRLISTHTGAASRSRGLRSQLGVETGFDHNPGGYTGMGEGGASGTHAAAANAVGDAPAHLGVRATSTPLGPEQIFALVEAARGPV